MRWRDYFAVIAIGIAVQDTAKVMMDHRQFAVSALCGDSDAMGKAGRYAAVHCTEHEQGANLFLLSSWAAAFTEANSGRVLWVLAWGVVNTVLALAASLMPRVYGKA